MTRHVVILGALSEIAEATARLLAAEGAALMLVGRDRARLDAVAADLRVRGAGAVHVAPLDLTTGDPAALLDAWIATLGGLDHVLLAYGQLDDRVAPERDPAAARALIEVNFGSAAGWCVAAANRLAAQGRGSLVAIGSVAGDRGRQSNFVYGASKAGLATLMEGIAHWLAPTGARAVLVKPGFVATAMTAHIVKGGPLWSTPDAVARIVRRAMDGRAVAVYAPGYWRAIMAVVRATPAAIFHRTRL